MRLSSTPPQASYDTFGTPAPSTRHPADDASVFSDLFLAWALPLIRQTRQLNLADLWPLQAVNSCEANTARFAAAYDASSSSIPHSIVRVYGGTLLLTGAMTAGMRFLEIVGPVVLNQVVSATTDADHSTLYWYLALLLVAKATSAILVARLPLMEEIFGLRLASALKGLLFRKLLGKVCHKQDNVVDLANAYSSDMDGLVSGCRSIHNLWIMPVQIAVASVVLYREIGVAAFAGMAVIVLVMGLTSALSKRQSEAYRRIARARDARMQVVKETFGSILVVKLHAWEQKCRDRIRACREIELTNIWSYMVVVSISSCMFWVGPLLVSTASFAVYTLVLGQSLTAAKVFTSMALFRVIQTPLTVLPMHITAVLQARVSLQRVSSYLGQPNKPTHRLPMTPPEASTMVVIENGSFGWGTDNQTPILTNISLTISRGDLVVVHGKVGSGKSSLCHAIMGEMTQTQGTTGVYGSIAYASQEAWIQQMSVRDNILFGAPFDSTKYTRVVDACGLLPDFALMKFGDLTAVGSKGCNLSGGQKARIGLARACYSNADIVILDAPLAAIDAVVQKEIMTKCIETLLKSKTVILVTHNADVIGSKSVNRLVELDVGSLKHTLVKPSSSTSSTPLSKNVVTVFASIEDQAKWGQHFENAISEQLGEEKRAVGRVGRGVYGSYVASFGGWPIILAMVVIQTATQVMQVGSDVWLGYWTASDDAVARTPWYLSIYAALCGGMMVTVLCRTLLVAVAGLNASRRLFDQMSRGLLGTSMSFFDATPTGRIVNRFAEDISSIDIWLPANYRSFTGWLFSVAASLLTSMIVVRWWGLLFLPLFYMYAWVTQVYLIPFREITRLWNVSNSPILSYLDEVDHGFTLIRAFGSAYMEQAMSRHAHHVDTASRARFARSVVNAWFDTCVALLGTMLVMIVAFGLVYFRAVLSAGLVGLVFNYILMVDANILELVIAYSWMENNMVYPERVLEFGSLENEDPEAPHKGQMTLTQGAIAFNHVQFRYKPTGEYVLQDLTCAIAGGEKIGIVGRTGAGKSSLTMVLFRMYPLTSGSISIDGRDIATIAKTDLRRHLSIIPQSPVLFKGTLRQYLDPFGAFDDAALWDVVTKAGLHSLVSGLPEKLSSEVAEKGSNLSVGERQMLCLARALLVQSKIVVLDEATAAMDHDTDVRLQQVIATEFATATVLTIAHRLHTVMHSDRIMVMDAGRVVEFDTPTALLAKED
ncbi:hypothetical protein As57867_004094, partial [Aphanomyces stellatus]